MAKTGSNFNSIDRVMGDKLPILRINQSSALDDLKSLNELKINEENIRQMAQTFVIDQSESAMIDDGLKNFGIVMA